MEFNLFQVNDSVNDNMSDQFSCSVDSNLFSVTDWLFAENKDAVTDTGFNKSDSKKNR